MTRPQRTVLVLNCGSSSVKYQLVEPDSGRQLADGIVERIGAGPIADHEAALRAAFDELAEAGTGPRRAGAGRGRAPGRARRPGPVPADGRRRRADRHARELSPLAPLHNPPAILGIEVARKVLPDLPHVAVFDTAFFHDLPAAAAHLRHRPRDVAAQWHIRRYGFHGTSHQYVSEQAAEFLGAPLESLNQIVLHLGNGASASAIVGGRPQRHVDGADADGGPGDGHPVGRRRPRRHHLPAAARRA